MRILVGCIQPISGRLIVIALLVVFPQLVTRAQNLVPVEEAPAVAKEINSHPRKNTLECYGWFLTPTSYVGFDLRYHAEFSFRFPIEQMPGGGKLEARIRVTPKKGTPVMLAEYFDIPTASQAASTLTQSASVGFLANISGDFVIGPGKYGVELLLISPDSRTFFKRWSVETYPASGLTKLMKPNTVYEDAPRWDGELNPSGVRLTLLLNATATGYSRVEDRNYRFRNYHFVLAMADTILKQLPCRSLRIVAFNLGQQVVLFQRNGLTAGDWGDLEVALKGAHVSKVDHRALSGAIEPDFLSRLLKKELSGPSDAVVLVGSRTQFLVKDPEKIKTVLHARSAKLYYIRHDGVINENDGIPFVGPDISYANGPYSPHDNDGGAAVVWVPLVGGEYVVKTSDSLTHLVQALNGTVIPFVSPSEFGRSIERLRAEFANLPAPSSNPSESRTPRLLNEQR